MPVTGNKPCDISVQVGLNGFSYSTDSCARSPWLGAEFVYGCDALQQPHDKASLSTMNRKFTLVPSSCFSEEQARYFLSDAVSLDEEDEVLWSLNEAVGAVEIWAREKGRLVPVVKGMLEKNGGEVEVRPELHFMLEEGLKLEPYNKIVASYAEGTLYLVIFQGKNLLLCNHFDAMEFTTAQYFIFRALKSFQINPETATLFFRTALSAEEEMALYQYVKEVKALGGAVVSAPLA